MRFTVRRHHSTKRTLDRSRGSAGAAGSTTAVTTISTSRRRSNPETKEMVSTSASSSAPPPPAHEEHSKILVEKDPCVYCKERGHYKKDCPKFLKYIMAKNGI